MKKIRRSTASLTIAICGDCGGEGKIFIPGEKIGHNHWTKDQEETCDTCEGEGMVRVERQIYTVTTITPRSHE